jgi:hypothetical protein
MTKTKIVCPVCKQSDEVIPIVYGYPGDDLFKKQEKGEVYLGGCVIRTHNPHWYCKRDDKKF